MGNVNGECPASITREALFAFVLRYYHAMCLIIFAYRADPRFPLVVAANRDEFFTRPTAQADFWQSASGSRILAGKDLQAGGTWLGITPGGRFAAVTNIRDPSQAEAKPRSRGELTSSFLGGKLTATQFCAGLSDSFADYAGYNLLVGDGEQLVYVNNVERTSQVLSPGIHGLSNGRLNSDWPKVTRGREHLAALLTSAIAPRTDDLLKMMSDPRPAPDDQLPDTGVPRDLEKSLSAAFIRNPERQYGTRCSTALLVAADGAMRFGEANFDSDARPIGKHFFELPAAVTGTASDRDQDKVGERVQGHDPGAANSI
jgi:uncharacterized protein with NRDE domain